MAIELEKDKEWKTYVLSRCSELAPKIMGKDEPALEDALMYFKWHDVMYSVFGLGRDLSEHPRNPFRKNKEKTLDNSQNISHIPTMTDKEKAIIEFLKKEIETLSVRVFAKEEPILTDRMTFFAYNQYLWCNYKIGNDMQNHPRNPWKGVMAPLNFADYSQIRPLPESLRDSPLAKTQPLPTIQPVVPEPEKLFRVFDVDHPTRTVYQGNESSCNKYVAKANKDCCYKAFDYVETSTKFTPNERKTEPPVINRRNCSCETPQRTVYTYKTSKTKVQEYLEKLKQQQPEETAETKTTEQK